MASEDMEIRLLTDGEKDFRALAANLRRAGNGQLQLALRRNLRAAAQPVLGELRTAVQAVTVSSSRGGTAHPDYSRQLRSRIAKALRISVAYRGVRFNVQGQAMGDPKYGAVLAKYMDSTLPGYQKWRHPVFGNTEVWEEQRGQPWFFVTIMENAATFEAACVEAVNEVIREIG